MLAAQGYMPDNMYDDTFSFAGSRLVHRVDLVYTSATRYEMTSTYTFSEQKKRYVLKNRTRKGTDEYEKDGNWIVRNGKGAKGLTQVKKK